MIVARYSLATIQTMYDATNIRVVWDSKQFDSAKDLDPTKGMDTTTGIYTFGEAGYYDFRASLGLVNSVNITSGHRVATYYKKNGGSLKKIAGLTFGGTFFETAQWNGGGFNLFRYWRHVGNCRLFRFWN